MNKKVLLQAAFVLAAMACKGGDSLKISENHLYIGANTSLDYCYRAQEEEKVPRQYEYNEYGKAGYTFGMDVKAHFGKKAFLELGLLYANRGYKVKGQALATNGSQIYIVNEQATVDLSYYDFPLTINYIFPSPGKTEAFLGIGFAVNSWQKTEVNHHFPDGELEDFKYVTTRRLDGKNVFFSIVMNFGFNMNLSSRSELQADLVYRRMFGQLTTDQLWSLGLNVTYYCRLI